MKRMDVERSVLVILLWFGVGVVGAAERLTWAKAGPPDSVVTLMVAPTHLACEISLRSEEEDALAKWNGIEEGRLALGVLAQKAGLELRAESIPEVAVSYGKSSFSSSGPEQEPVYPLVLLVPLKAGTNVVQAVKQMRNVVGQFKTGKKVRVSMGAPQLVHDDAEKHREELLQRISAHVQRTGSRLGFKSEPLISGLEGPVQARTRSDQVMELFLPFRVTYQSERRSP